MKKLITLLLLASFQCSAQYFDWNKFILSSDGNMSGAEVTSVSANPTGGCSFNGYTVSFGWQSFYSYLLSDTGMITYNGVGIDHSSPTYLGYDWNGQLMEIVTYNFQSYITFKYYRTNDTLEMHFQDNCIAGADTTGHIIIYFKSPFGNGDSITVFDSSGIFLNTIYHDFSDAKCDKAGNIYVNDGAGGIYKYDINGNIITVFTGTEFCINGNGALWVRQGNQVKQVDTSGTVLFTYNVSTGNLAFAADQNNNLFIWNGNTIRKWSGNTLIWETSVAAAYIRMLAVDDSSNLYYFGKYIQNHYDNDDGFIPGYINIPPSLFDSWPELINGFGDMEIIYAGEISSGAPSFSAEIKNAFPANGYLCTDEDYLALMDLQQMPVQYATDTIYIELSDSAGSFANPYIVGKGFGTGITYRITDALPEGSSYRIRARLGDTLYITAPYTDSVSIAHTPEPTVILQNSILNYKACPPFVLYTNSIPGYTYDWAEILDPWFDEQVVFMNDFDTLFNVPMPDPGYFSVYVTDTVSGCSSRSELLHPEEIDSTYVISVFLPLPDTLHINDVPVSFIFSNNFNLQAAALDSAYYSASVTMYTFDPANATAGDNTILITAMHDGSPCVPYTLTDHVFVDSVPWNIIMDTVSNNQYICVQDTALFYFHLLDSTLYNASNVFTVEMGHVNSSNFIYLADLGSGQSSPVTGIYPSSNFNSNIRFRIRSSQTGERSTLNPDGNKTYGSIPAASYGGGISAGSQCFPLNDSIEVNTGNYLHTWLINDTIVKSVTGNNIGISTFVEGSYLLMLTNNAGGCRNKLGPLVVDDSTYFPAITLTPTGPYFTICQEDGITIHAGVSQPAIIEWYGNSSLIASGVDSLFINNDGIYQVVATGLSSCPAQSQQQFGVTENPYLLLNTALYHSLCTGDSVRLNCNFTLGSTFAWKDSSGNVISTVKQCYVKKPGYYHAEATNASGCTTISDTVIVSWAFSPIATLPVGTVNINSGTTVTLQALNSGSYDLQWYYYNYALPGATQSSYVASLAGIYHLLASDSSGCGVSSDNISLRRVYIQTTPPPPVGRNMDESDFAGFSVYPNPNNGSFTIGWKNLSSEKLYGRITDISGRVVYEFTRSNIVDIYKEEFNLVDLQSGYYNFYLRNGETEFAGPLIIN